MQYDVIIKRYKI